MMPTSAIGSGRAHGFTLLELMVVMAIMVLLTSALPFAFNRMVPARRAALAAEGLVANIRWLQAQSSASGSPGRITLQKQGYQLHVQGLKKDIALARTTHAQFLRRDAAVELDELLIFPDGTCTPARILVADSGRRIELAISMLTGSVQ